MKEELEPKFESESENESFIDAFLSLTYEDVLNYICFVCLIGTLLFWYIVLGA